LIKRQRILITGRVQGVGFRPAVYNIAKSLALGGFVCNDTKGVTIELQGRTSDIARFAERLRTGPEKPLPAIIKSFNAVDIPVVADEKEFIIKASDSKGSALSQVTEDMAVCGDCLVEMDDENDFRFGYPFINCTNCGPRYSIVKNIPYDRANTTMQPFKMCRKCSSQYTDVTDRRFHAQPVACEKCGPGIWLTDSRGKKLYSETNEVIRQTARILLDGGIVAIKGIGGFHLAVDALNNNAVERLRQRKKRDHKPFALMAENIEKIKQHAIVTESEEMLLKSPQSPIVLLPKRKDSTIAPAVAEGVSTFGFMLCYAPLHYLLFAKGPAVLVMTSGNISDEPLICENSQALEKLGSVADAFLMHNRQIFRRVDDSIIHLIDGRAVLLRRARGFVPAPVSLDFECARDILAVGPDLKNTFCFVKKNQFICSEHIGDLEDAGVYHHYIDSVEHLAKLYEVSPKIIACDLHPGYLSTQYATLRCDKPLQIQHHWAHIASVLAEHNQTGPVIGLSCDGTGYGSDGVVWGCECLIASLSGFERFAHLAYYPLAGADKAAKEAIRPLLGLLKKTYADEFRLEDFQWLLKTIEPDIKRQKIILSQIEKQVNTVATSSLGRVFDAAAAMLGLGSYNHFEAQLPMAIESIIADDVQQQYDFELKNTAEQPLQLDLSMMIKQIIADIKNNCPAGVIAARFHNGLAAGLLKMAKKAKKKTHLDTVALSGGVFCNRYLINRLVKLLKKDGFRVLFNKEVPSNDGGISLGQAAIAANVAKNNR
jgi:hydrogenase maturation protein HypF